MRPEVSLHSSRKSYCLAGPSFVTPKDVIETNSWPFEVEFVASGLIILALMYVASLVIEATFGGPSKHILVRWIMKPYQKSMKLFWGQYPLREKPDKHLLAAGIVCLRVFRVIILLFALLLLFLHVRDAIVRAG